MNKKENILEILRKVFPSLSSEFSIKKIALFGSAAKETMHSDSDVDIVVEFGAPIGFRFNQLVVHLETLLGRKVDVLTKEGLKNIRVKEVAEDIERSLVYV